MNELKGARYVGVRYPICQPDGTRIDMHAIAVDHPNGPWEAIYCRTQEQAETIVKQEALSDKLVSRVVDNMLSEAELLKKCESLKSDCIKWQEMVAKRDDTIAVLEEHLRLAKEQASESFRQVAGS